MNKNKWTAVLFAGSALFLTSCDAIFDVSASTPRGVFDTFWQDFKDIYAYMDEHDFSTEATMSISTEDLALFNNASSPEELAEANLTILYHELDPRIDENSTWDDLYEIFVGPTVWPLPPDTKQSIAELLNDIHFVFITLHDPNYSDYVGEDATEFHQTSGWPVTLHSPEYDGFAYGVVNGSTQKIGYIYVDQLVEELSGSNRIFGGDEWIAKIDDIVAHLHDEGVTRLIFDMRGPAGGSFHAPRYIARRFVEKRAKAIKLLERDERGRLTRDSFIEIEPGGNTALADVPMVLVTNGLTCSGGEFLVLMLKTKENIIHLGENTAGCSGGIVDRDLPDGTIVRYTSSKTWQIDTDGSNPVSYFQDGIVPDTGVSAVQGTFADEIIDAAITALELDPVVFP